MHRQCNAGNKNKRHFSGSLPPRIIAFIFNILKVWSCFKNWQNITDWQANTALCTKITAVTGSAFVMVYAHHYLIIVLCKGCTVLCIMCCISSAVCCSGEYSGICSPSRSLSYFFLVLQNSTITSFVYIQDEVIVPRLCHEAVHQFSVLNLVSTTDKSHKQFVVLVTELDWSWKWVKRISSLEGTRKD